MSEITADTLFKALSNSRRRGVIMELSNGPTTLSDVADVIAEKEKGKGVDSEGRKTVYVCLYQGHLDKLDDADIINYDKRSGEITKGEHHNLAYSILRLVDSSISQSMFEKTKDKLKLLKNV